MANRIIIFAKAPVPGKVKTRLIPALGAEGAARLAREMLATAIREALGADIGPVELCGDPPPTDPAWRGAIGPARLHFSEQGGGGLGERLARAADRTVAAGARPLLIGTDCPALDRERLSELARQLQAHDAVLQPAEDGGYVALGLKQYHPSVFEGIAWSTPSVADETRRRIAALGWSLFVGEPLRDIDTPADLAAEVLDP